MVSPQPQTCLRNNMNSNVIPTIIPPTKRVKNENQCSLPLASLKLLNCYGNGFRRLCRKRKNEPSDDLAVVDVGRKLSTEDIMNIAGTRFIQSSSQPVDLQSLTSYPYDFSFSGLSDEEKKDVELAATLLASAEKVGRQQFGRASKLLKHCDSLASKNGSPVQRIVYYFSEALHRRIERETGRLAPKDLHQKESFDLDEVMASPTPVALACHEGLPFSQVSQFAEVQTITENVTVAKKIHIIDLKIKNEVQWTVLMQALESLNNCPIELLKITAVGTTSKHLMEGTGKRLMVILVPSRACG